MTKFSKLLATAVLLAGATPALAVPISSTPVAKGKVLILRPLSFVNTGDLNFGTVVSSGVAGTVTIDPDTGARGGAGGVTLMSSDVGGRGTFAGAGSPSQLVIVTLNPPAVLTNAASDTVTVDSMALDGSGLLTDTRTIDPVDLTFYVAVGGQITVAADQPDGDYSADYLITADYQ